MNSTLSTLPDDFGTGAADTLIYFYSNDRSSARNKVVFTSNMCCLLQHGVKEVQTAAGKELVTNADLLLMTRGSSLMSESLAANGRYEAILVFFGNEALLDACRGSDLPAVSAGAPASVLKVRRDDFLDNYCRSLQLLKADVAAGMSRLKVQELLAYLNARYPETFAQLVAHACSDPATIRLKQVVDAQGSDSLSTEELAFLCNMSLSTFKRRFAQLYGMPPHVYFTHAKMERAKKLLRLQRRPSEIYEELGYERLSSFSGEFRKHCGCSPRQFQRENEPAAQEAELSEE